ncbi:hypothetical protein [Halalkalicoccus paucihalophilus]|uniref:hypothetical protein n=1 Tax=Halalkalicoccus paucihalophilus TaxID=1008153 RepID=UPI000832CB18|nr:hypothetical protein [Halalkalicoccus paucihalophilus]
MLKNAVGVFGISERLRRSDESSKWLCHFEIGRIFDSPATPWQVRLALFMSQEKTAKRSFWAERRRSRREVRGNCVLARSRKPEVFGDSQDRIAAVRPDGCSQGPALPRPANTVSGGATAFAPAAAPQTASTATAQQT